MVICVTTGADVRPASPWLSRHQPEFARTVMTAEHLRLAESRDRQRHWKRWGPYLSERAWGTVREDYSRDGTAWEHFSHDQARSRVYRWNEDGLAGISDRHQLICFALSLWNGSDPILKERPFGLTGKQGNHGEDVKEYYFYLDSTPTHSYMKYLYKYPHAAFPYADLVEENGRRGKGEAEYELLDTGIFDGDRYFDVVVEYAKADIEDMLIKVSVTNRGPEPAPVWVLPTAWFRNTWAWNRDRVRPELHEVDSGGDPTIEINHPRLHRRWLYSESPCELLFTDNETNSQRIFGVPNRTPFVKDGINDFVVSGAKGTVNPERSGTKAAANYKFTLAAGETAVVRMRLSDVDFRGRSAFDGFENTFTVRQTEANEFYATVISPGLSADAQSVMRQAFAGMLWSKQFYHYVVRDWLEGDPPGPAPPEERKRGRNREWTHLYNADVISMPDKWEYPWYAAWDLAFHCVPLALVDPDFAKEQLTLMLREWYMHPNGQLPAYEWQLGDVNPPVHAWAAWRVYKIDKKLRGKGDRAFLKRTFHKLLLNFTWWVNRKDIDGMNVFQGGFLGLDNIGVFNRSDPLPTGGHIEQSDASSWMAMYTLNLLAIALELAREEPEYEDVASKFWEHFIHIAHAINHRGNDGIGLWDESDGFYYDVLKFPGGGKFPMRVRSMVGLIPLFAIETLEPEVLDRLPGFKRRLEWFIDNRPDLLANMSCIGRQGRDERRLLSIANPAQLRRILGVMLDESEFLSPHGIRSLSQYHRQHPYTLTANGTEHRVDYEPGESSNGLFGGNSNWRGPVWFPVNYLLVESLQKFHHYLGDDFKVEFPTGSARMLTLREVAAELSRRLTGIFLRNEHGRRPVFGGLEKFQTDPHWRDLVLFHEYFDGDEGVGLGSSHQTGWTGLVSKMLQQSGE
jgi:Glycosyl hydrolase family 63 C-terminal domain/Domain of unknown function (DUF4332)